jgi:hypothetical protein
MKPNRSGIRELKARCDTSELRWMMRSQSQNRSTSDLPRRRQVRQLLMIKNRKAAWRHLTLSGNHLQYHRRVPCVALRHTSCVRQR